MSSMKVFVPDLKTGVYKGMKIPKPKKSVKDKITITFKEAGMRIEEEEDAL